MVRERPATPAVVFTTRHLLGGAVEVSGETWDEATSRLTATIATVPDEPFVVYVAEAGRTATDATLDEGAATLTSRDGLTAITFTATAAETTVTVQF